MINPAIKAALADVERAIEELDPDPTHAEALASEFRAYAQAVRRWHDEWGMRHFFAALE